MNQISKYTYHLLITAAVSMVAIGTIFYHLTEKWSLLDAYYFSVVSLTTVGYGDLVPQTASGKLFTTFYIMAGIGILGAFINAFVKVRGQKVQERVHKRQENKHKQ